jgi:TRAP-type uncharacterized transport system fused permease subunit
MRLGLVNFVLPFLFVLNPTLLLIGDPWHIFHDVLTACFAIWLLAAGLEGWLYGIGRIGWLFRVPLIVGAFGLLTPGIVTDLIGAGLAAAVYGVNLLWRRRTA